MGGPGITGTTPDGRLRDIGEDPRYVALVAERMRYAWRMSAVVVAIFFGYIGVIAFEKDALAAPLGEGWTTTVGIPVGLGVIIAGIALTALYVHRANKDFDPRMREILRDHEDAA